MKMIHVEGTPTQLGRQLGEQLHDAARGFADMVRPTDRSIISSAPARELRRYLEHAAPFLCEEIDAFGQAAGLSPEEAFYLTYLEDIPGPDRSWPAAVSNEDHDCTVVMLRNPEQGVIFGNTTDISARFAPLFRLIVRAPTDGHRFVCTSRAGQIGCSRGTNEAGLVMGGASAPYGETVGPGLGIYVAIRLALQTCSTVCEVIDLLRHHTVASKGHCYGVADASGDAAIVEVVHNRFVVRPFTGQWIYAVNRFESSELSHLNSARGPQNQRSCETRGHLLETFLQAPGRRYDLQDAQAALRLSDPRGLGVSAANTQFAVLCHPQERRFWLCDGRPADSEFCPIQFQSSIVHVDSACPSDEGKSSRPGERR